MTGIKFFKNDRLPWHEQGFTILEVLIAMAILAIGILAVGTMQISATQGNTVARKVTEASEFAQTRIETLLAAPYTSIPLGISTDTTGGYEIKCTVTFVPALNPIGVTVQVEVKDPQGTLRSRLSFNRYPSI